MFSIITINDINPLFGWDLHAIMLEEVYEMKWWHYETHTHINISLVDIAFNYKEEPIHINLINKEKIDCDKYKGYKNIHLSVVKLGLVSLVGPFILVSSLCVVFL